MREESHTVAIADATRSEVGDGAGDVRSKVRNGERLRDAVAAAPLLKKGCIAERVRLLLEQRVERLSGRERCRASFGCGTARRDSNTLSCRDVIRVAATANAHELRPRLEPRVCERVAALV